MKTLSNSQIGKRIAAVRKKRGFSQYELSTLLEISRSTMTQIELGNRELSAAEFIKLSEILRFPMDQFVMAEYQNHLKSLPVSDSINSTQAYRISSPVIDVEKLQQVMLYILEQGAGKANIGETVLNKLLYFADFNYFELYEEHLSGLAYRKLPFGPVPVNLDEVITKMIANKLIIRIKTKYYNLPQNRYIPLIKPNLTVMSAA